MLDVAAAGQAPLGSSWMLPPVRWDYVQSPEDVGRPKGRDGRHPQRPSLSPQRLEGDLELLAVFTHVVMAVSVAALLLTAAILLSLRSLKSNMRAIHANVAAALGVAELLFLLGIHRTHNQVQGRGQGTCVLMTLPGLGSPGAKAQGQRSGMLRSGPRSGAQCWGEVLWFRGQKRDEAGVALTPPNPAFSWCAPRSPSSCTTSSSAPSRGSLCRGCTSTACTLSPATWTAEPCASTTPWAGAFLPCCWVRALHTA